LRNAVFEELEVVASQAVDGLAVAGDGDIDVDHRHVDLPSEGLLGVKGKGENSDCKKPRAETH
jgi:hypothetical protein